MEQKTDTPERAGTTRKRITPEKLAVKRLINAVIKGNFPVPSGKGEAVYNGVLAFADKKGISIKPEYSPDRPEDKHAFGEIVAIMGEFGVNGNSETLERTITLKSGLWEKLQNIRKI